MKRRKIIAVLVLMLALLMGCSEEEPVSGSIEPAEGGGAVITLRIVDGADTGSLVLAGQNEMYTLNTDGLDVTLDGQPADAADLEDGMMIEVVFSGLELYTGPVTLDAPTAIAAHSIPADEYHDLAGLYLRVMVDLWEEASPVGGPITVDLSEAPGGLTPGERAAITWVFTNEHSGEEQGTEVQSSAALPVTLIIGPSAAVDGDRNQAPAVHFDAEIQGNTQGVNLYQNCTAVWSEAEGWAYGVGRYAIGCT